MIRELRLFLVAVQFLTRIPTPHLDDLPADWLARSGKYFPFVGALVGGLSALVLVSAHIVWRSGPLPALLALAASVLLTGALHQDGLADTVDAFGGGQSPEQRLAIMKDPRLGTYGALALGFAEAIKVVTLTTLPVRLAAVGLICAHAGARTAAVWTMSFQPYATERDASKINAPQRRLHLWELAVTLTFTLALSMLLIKPAAAIACVAVAALTSWLAACASQARIDGHTGDVLGAVEQIYELFFLLTLCGLSALGLLVR